MIRSIFRSIFYNTLLLDLYQRLNTQYGAILMFHRVAEPDPDGIIYNQHLKVSPEFFSRFIERSLQQGYSFVSMDESAELLQKKKKLKKVLCMTFDDGYRDNLTHALPILEAFNVPAVIYCATGFLTGEYAPWWDLIEKSILISEELAIPSGERVSCCSMDEKENVFLQIRKYFLQFSGMRLNEELSAFFEMNNIVMNDLKFNDMMTLDDLVKYQQHPLLTWGCHTHSHLSAVHISPTVFQEDLQTSLQIFKDAGYQPHHFAFPYGDDLTAQQEINNILCNSGFRTAVSTDPGIIRSDINPDIMFLPRLFISQFDKRVKADYIIAAELLHAKLTRFKKI